jgi:hypothetical protein
MRQQVPAEAAQFTDDSSFYFKIMYNQLQTVDQSQQTPHLASTFSQLSKAV